MTTRTYQVRSGDTLATITQREYGNVHLFKNLARYNRIPSADLIKVGQTIYLPPETDLLNPAKHALHPQGASSGGATTQAAPGPPPLPAQSSTARKSNTTRRGRFRARPEIVKMVEHVSDEQIRWWIYFGRIHVGKSVPPQQYRGGTFPAFKNPADFKEWMTAVEQVAWNKKLVRYSPDALPAPGTEPADENGHKLTPDQLLEGK